MEDHCVNGVAVNEGKSHALARKPSAHLHLLVAFLPNSATRKSPCSITPGIAHLPTTVCRTRDPSSPQTFARQTAHRHPLAR